MLSITTMHTARSGLDVLSVCLFFVFYVVTSTHFLMRNSKVLTIESQISSKVSLMAYLKLNYQLEDSNHHSKTISIISQEVAGDGLHSLNNPSSHSTVTRMSST